MEASPKGIVFFDGECGFCRRSVRLLLEADRGGALQFAPRAGESAKRLLPAEYLNFGADRVQSLLYLRSGAERPFIYSDATLQALADIGGVWGLLALFRIIPPVLRDGVYRMISKNRHRITKLLDASSCQLPAAEQSQRFLP